MKKVGLLYREKIVEKIIEDWKNSEGCIFASFSKVSAFNFNALRNSLKKEGSYAFISKNSLIKRAVEKLEIKEAEQFIEGSTALFFVNQQNLVKVARVLFDFSQENESFILKGAFLNSNRLGEKELEAISKLPSREVLIGEAVMGIASPLVGFVGMLNNIILEFAWIIEGIKKKKAPKV